MAFRTHLLVVANQTVGSPELLSALKERGRQSPIHATLLTPCSWAQRDEARQRADAAAASLQADGIEAEVVLGDTDPVVAVQEAWNPARFDEVVVSTLAAPVSRWMQIDVPHRIARLTDCTVRHIETQPLQAAAERTPSPPPPHPPVLESVLSLMRTATRRGA